MQVHTLRIVIIMLSKGCNTATFSDSIDYCSSIKISHKFCMPHVAPTQKGARNPCVTSW